MARESQSAPPVSRVEGFIRASLAAVSPGSPLTLDHVAEAIGTAAVTTDEIAAIIDGIEKRGHQLQATEQSSPRADLHPVLTSARAIRAEQGRAPRITELSARTGLTPARVMGALNFARIMAR